MVDMEQEVASVQPWHCFTTMFVVFWAISAYFDHFLMTMVFCIAFGVLAEIYVKHVVNGDKEEVYVDETKEDREKLRQLEIERIKQEQEILEIMKAQEELEKENINAEIAVEIKKQPQVKENTNEKISDELRPANFYFI